MKSKNVTRTLLVTDGIKVTKVHEFLISLDKIEEITPFFKVSHYLRDNGNNSLNKNR